MNAHAAAISAAIGLLCSAPTAAAEAPEFPDLSGYQADSPTSYQHGTTTQFHTPDGLLCGIQPGHAWCYGNLPSVPSGANVADGTGFTHWDFLPPDADQNAPVMSPMHSLTVTADQATTSCVVGAGALTACKSDVMYPAGGGVHDGFLLSPLGSRVW